MARQIFPSFREEQGESRYPFGDHCSLISTDGLVIDSAMVIDVSLYPVGVHANLSITEVVVGYSEIIIYIGNAANPQLVSFTYNPLDAPDRIAGYVGEKLAGLLLVDATAMAALQAWPSGSHTFAEGTAEFVPTVTLPRPVAGVNKFILDDGAEFSGNVWIVGDSGVMVQAVNDTTFSISVVGDPLSRRRQCESTDRFRTPRFLRSVTVVNNGFEHEITPDTYGEISFFISTLVTPVPALRVSVVQGQSIEFGIMGSAIDRG